MFRLNDTICWQGRAGLIFDNNVDFRSIKIWLNITLYTPLQINIMWLNLVQYIQRCAFHISPSFGPNRPLCTTTGVHNSTELLTELNIRTKCFAHGYVHRVEWASDSDVAQLQVYNISHNFEQRKSIQRLQRYSFSPKGMPIGANGLMTLTLYNYRSRQFPRNSTITGKSSSIVLRPENPSSCFRDKVLEWINEWHCAITCEQHCTVIRIEKICSTVSEIKFFKNRQMTMVLHHYTSR